MAGKSAKVQSRAPLAFVYSTDESTTSSAINSRQIWQIDTCQNVAIQIKARCMSTHVMVGSFDLVSIKRAVWNFQPLKFSIWLRNFAQRFISTVNINRLPLCIHLNNKHRTVSAKDKPEVLQGRKECWTASRVQSWKTRVWGWMLSMVHNHQVGCELTRKRNSRRIPKEKRSGDWSRFQRASCPAHRGDEEDNR